jgi:hypothetical protein
MRQQEVSVRIALREDIVQLVPNHPRTASPERLMEMPSKLTFRHAKIVRSDHFVKTKVHSSHLYVWPDLTRTKHQPLSALSVQREHIRAHMEAKIHRIAKYVRRAHIVQKDPHVLYFAMQEPSTVKLGKHQKYIA